MNNNKIFQFKDVINNYINVLNCTANELSKKSNISASVISRYRSGDKIPKSYNKQLDCLIKAILLIAKEKNIKEINSTEVKDTFNSVLNIENINFENLKYNLNILIEELNINVTDISHYLGYDPSYISKIRSGIRKPAYLDLFIDGIINYTIKNIDNNKIIDLTKIKKNDIKLNLRKWLCSNNTNQNYINKFFININNFNLNEYIKIIHFNELKIFSIPFQLPKSKKYYGIEEMKKAELDFFKGTILSKNTKNVFMCSDMKMDDMAKDIEFGKKWMFALALMIKKGITINIIHDLNRPFNEMMLGIESWLPIYMTGQVNPYYINKEKSKIYSHLNYVSEKYALTGESIVGFHEKGKYYLTNNNKEIDYYKMKFDDILSKAKPAMEIYTNNNKNNYNLFFNKDHLINSDRKRILSSLPLHTLSEELLINILKYNEIDDNEIKIYIEYWKKEKKYISIITKNNDLTDEIYLLNEKEFNINKPTLFTNNLFIENDIKYNYNYYLKHYNLTKKYKNNNYKCIVNKIQIFNKIDIYINKNNYAIISKKDNPNIKFVIKQETLLNAIEKFTPPIKENNIS